MAQPPQSQTPLPHPTTISVSHAPDVSTQPWMFSRRELVVTPAMLRSTALRTGLVIAIATLVLAMLASEPLVGWTNRLPAHPVAEKIIVAAQAWNEAMAAIGMTDVFEALRRFFGDLRSL